MISLPQKGQNLIEITIAMAAIGIVLGGLVIVTLTGLKNSQFAQNQSKATKYAQETIDQIRSIRDQIGSHVRINSFNDSGDPITLEVSFNDEVLTDDSKCTFLTPCYFSLDIDNSLQEIRGTSTEISLPNDPQLTREIKLQKDGDGIPQLTVRIIWTDSKGLHESNLQTYLMPIL